MVDPGPGPSTSSGNNDTMDVSLTEKGAPNRLADMPEFMVSL